MIIGITKTGVVLQAASEVTTALFQILFWKGCDSHRNVDSAAGPTPPLRSHVALQGLGFREARRGKATQREATSNKARRTNKNPATSEREASERARRQRKQGPQRVTLRVYKPPEWSRKKKDKKTFIITFPHWSAVESFSNLAHFRNSFTRKKKISLVSSSNNMLCSLLAHKVQK